MNHAESKRLLYPSISFLAQTQLAAVGEILQNEEQIVLRGVVVRGVQLRGQALDASAENLLVILQRVR